MSSLRDLNQREVRIPQGTIRYRELGSGDPIVLVHGLLVNGLLWEGVAERLAKDFRVIVPDWPLGSQALPLDDGADLSPPGLARLIADFLEQLGLTGVTLVGNDTGGALCQLVAVNHPDRVARLVLTPCDTYENFPPPLFAPLMLLGRSPAFLWLIGNSMRSQFAQRLPIAFGWLSRRPLDRDVARAFLAPVMTDKAIRRQLARILAGIDKRHTLAAAEQFATFEKPVLIAWAPEDKFFTFRFAERLARDFPDARLERIEDSYTFVSVDQPARTAELIAEFARQPVPAAV